MLARCDARQNPFVTPRAGTPACPRRGARVVAESSPRLESGAPCLSRPLAGAVTNLPVLCYAAWELLLQLHVARPCFNLG